MRVSKCHPQLGWLRLEARDYSRTMDRLLSERDKLADINWTGPAPAYLEWVAEVELPELARRDYYRQQMQEHSLDLQRQAESVRADLNRQAPDLLEQLRVLEADVQRIEEVLA
jgi:hypothetical protein